MQRIFSYYRPRQNICNVYVFVWCGAHKAFISVTNGMEENWIVQCEEKTNSWNQDANNSNVWCLFGSARMKLKGPAKRAEIFERFFILIFCFSSFWMCGFYFIFAIEACSHERLWTSIAFHWHFLPFWQSHYGTAKKYSKRKETEIWNRR